MILCDHKKYNYSSIYYVQEEVIVGQQQEGISIPESEQECTADVSQLFDLTPHDMNLQECQVLCHDRLHRKEIVQQEKMNIGDTTGEFIIA